MTYKVNILANADEDLTWLRQNDRTSYVKCFDLVREVAKNPRAGTGKPERLRYFEQLGNRNAYAILNKKFTAGESIKKIEWFTRFTKNSKKLTFLLSAATTTDTFTRTISVIFKQEPTRLNARSAPVQICSKFYLRAS